MKSTQSSKQSTPERSTTTQDAPIAKIYVAEPNGTLRLHSTAPASHASVGQAPAADAARLRGPSASAVGAAVVFVVEQLWKLIDDSTPTAVTDAKPHASAVILRDTTAADYSNAESWQSPWYGMELCFGHLTLASCWFRIRASTRATPNEKPGVTRRPGMYIPNLAVDTDRFYSGFAQHVSIAVSLSSPEFRPSTAGPSGSGAAYVEVTITMTTADKFTQSASSLTFSVRGDETKATLLK